MSVATRERPILMSAPMANAIRSGRKTQTRQIVKPQPSLDAIALYCGDIHAHDMEDDETGASLGFGFQDDAKAWRCPYGQPGDRLWVRETWGLPCWDVDEDGECWGVDDWDGPIPKSPPAFHKPVFAADGRWAGESVEDRGFRWRPSIHMPRWASRLTLEITEVRVERLNGIGPRDAYAEGARCTCMRPVPMCKGNIDAFRNIWESINGPGSWARNEYVWSISFRRVEGGAE